VGEQALIHVKLAAPSGEQVTITQGLPAGCRVDVAAMEGQSGVVWVDVNTDSVVITTAPARAGAILEVDIPVQPAFAGTFSTTPLTVQVRGESAQLAPMTWVVGSPEA